MSGAAGPDTTTCRRRLVGAALVALLLVTGVARAATYYVRQTIGDDTHDGLGPQAAWQHLSKLSSAMHAGDVAYVGPGLYREEVVVENDGAPDARIVFVADTTGQHTGDPPGTVMVTGADPVDGTIFAPHASPGVYTARIPSTVWGAVEMDGPQYRYGGTRETRELVVEKMSPVDVVAKLPSTYYYDDAAKVLYLHTSDGRPPATHEMELITRGNGILVQGKRHVTVMGFTFRHMQDSGISFFKDAGDGIAVDNTSYGSRQGIRVYGAPDVLVYGNTLFRNENSGVYFAARSTKGVAIGNTAYENVKGVRWSSQSVDGLCLDNTLFENRERGIAIENADRILVRRNKVVDNSASQVLVIESAYSAEADCYETHRPGELVAEFYPYFERDRHATLAEYQRARHQDLSSRAGGCGPLPAKVDVHRLQAETAAYAARARKLLSGAQEAAVSGGVRRWLDWLRGK
ncbi:MAG: right-handed parallel beta-helix repeat-containing protein [Deltaproteobacteria bacterium]|nr:MAG: right-handed parallel beta-helix repeat-containing protein [Deltaproteobacteria bacterium]